jgi:hypothetical protein
MSSIRVGESIEESTRNLTQTSEKSDAETKVADETIEILTETSQKRQLAKNDSDVNERALKVNIYPQAF